jgi:hypothetical protein
LLKNYVFWRVCIPKNKAKNEFVILLRFDQIEKDQGGEKRSEEGKSKMDSEDIPQVIFAKSKASSKNVKGKNSKKSKIYFPIDSHQPTTPEAAVWSCANVDANNPASPITLWYIDAFFTQNFGFDKRNAALQIIQCQELRYQHKVDNAFREITANPVGRVLLYRLLIEIRRQDVGNMGCCGDGICCDKWNILALRDAARGIRVEYLKGEFKFGSAGDVIKCDLDIQTKGECVRINAAVTTIDTINLQVNVDIPLFHEMLHWFQLLRHPFRYFCEAGNHSPSEYMYLSRCYFGNMCYYFAFSGKCDLRETRTILGAPNYNTAAELALFHPGTLLPANPGGGIPVGTGFLPPGVFYNGDDLSENAYRMAKHAAAVAAGANPIRMRFGHGGVIGPIDITGGIPNAFQLAHLVARNCCNAIVTVNGGVPINNWRLISGEAAQ